MIWKFFEIFNKFGEFIEIDVQIQKVQGQKLASSVCARPLDDLHRVSSAYPVIFSERICMGTNT